MNEIDLINTINSLGSEKTLYLEEYDAYVINANNHKGVAIENINSFEIKENFNKVIIQNGILTIEKKNKSINALFLITTNEMMSDHYGFLCLDFLKINNRQSLLNNPMKWFNDWKQMLGNTVKKKMVYDVIGEMKTIQLLQAKNLSPIWNSMIEGSYDISCCDKLFEVKTTKTRTDSFVTIHSQFQLESNNNLFISFVRVEENETGESIDSLASSIPSKEIDKSELENYLSSIGYGVGKEERYKKYIIHEIKFYPVDDDFPKITSDSFVEGHMPNNVVKIEYTISLDGLKYTKEI